MPNLAKPTATRINTLLSDALTHKDKDKFAEGLGLLRPKVEGLVAEYRLGSRNVEELITNAEEKAYQEFQKANAQRIGNPQNYFLKVLYNAIREELRSGNIPTNLGKIELNFDTTKKDRFKEAREAVSIIEGKVIKEDDDFQDSISVHETRLHRKRKKEPVLYDPHPQLQTLRRIVDRGNQGIKILEKKHESTRLLVDTMDGIVGPEVVKRYLLGYRQVEIASELSMPASNIRRAIRKWVIDKWLWDETETRLVMVSWLAHNLKGISLRIKKDIKRKHHPGLPNKEVGKALMEHHFEMDSAKRLAGRMKELSVEGLTVSQFGRKLVREGWNAYKVRECIEFGPESWIRKLKHERKEGFGGFTYDDLRWGLWKPELWRQYRDRLVTDARNDFRTAAHFRGLKDDDKVWLFDVIQRIERIPIPWRQQSLASREKS